MFFMDFFWRITAHDRAMNTQTLVLQVPDLPTKVRLARVARKLRQADVAAAARCSQAHVSSFERGVYVAPSIRRRILLALGLLEEVGA